MKRSRLLGILSLAASVMLPLTVHAQQSESDAKLQHKLLSQIESDRIGYGSEPFNAISVQVNNGVVTLGGFAIGPVSEEDAVSIAKNTKGVRQVINHIHVDPVSPMDNQIRRAEFRAIYGYPTFTKYAINPIKPIRIQVDNGHVTLLGVVDSEADKETAGIRANSVPNVFSVTNDLQVENSSNREK
jgi:hyperosmotically inducible protein